MPALKHFLTDPSDTVGLSAFQMILTVVGPRFA